MTTPLPPSTIGTGAIYTPSLSTHASKAPIQPRTAPIAHFASLPNDGVGNDSLLKLSKLSKNVAKNVSKEGIPTAGRLLAVNSRYIAYAVKKGLVRVIDRRSAAKTLLRGHDEKTRLADAAYFGDTSGKEGVGGLWDELASLNNNGNANGGDGKKQPLPPMASDVLATVGGHGDTSSVLIWRIHSSNGGATLGADKLLEVRFGKAGRVAWHPFNPNRFLLLHRNLGSAEEGEGGGKAVATLVETTHLVARHDSEGHKVCDCEVPEGKVGIPGMIPLKVSGNDGSSLAGANDISWSNKDAKHVLTGHDDGFVRLWDLTAQSVGGEGDVSVPCVAQLDVAASADATPTSKRVTRVIFLSQYETAAGGDAAATPPFLTGTDMNHTVTLWSSFPNPTPVRVFQLQAQPSPSLASVLSLELIPSPYRPSLDDGKVAVPSSFLLMAERTSGTVHALHLDTQWQGESSTSVAVNGFDSVTTLNVVHPVYSFCVAPAPERNDDGSGGGAAGPNALKEERDVDLCCIQSKAVQMLTLSAEMIGSDGNAQGMERGDLAPGVTLLDVSDPAEVSVGSDDVGEEEFEDEEYDMEEDMAGAVELLTNDDDDDDADAVPTATEAEPNAFSNWLGAIANPLPDPMASAPPAPKAEATAPPPPGLGFSSILPPPPGMAPSSLEVELVDSMAIDAMASSSAPPPPAPVSLAFLSPLQLLGGSSSNDLMDPEIPKESVKESSAAKPPPPKAKKPDRKSASPLAAVPPPGMPAARAPSPLPPKGAKKPPKSKKGQQQPKASQMPPAPAPSKILKREEPKDRAPSAVPPASSAATTVDLSSIESAVAKAVAAQLKAHESTLLASITKSVAAEVDRAAKATKKEVDQGAERAVREGVAEGVTTGLGAALREDAELGRRLESQARESAANAAREAVAGMRAPIVDSLHQTMREVMIPAYEAATRQMFEQTSASMQRGLAQIATNQTNESAPALQAMSAEMTRMGQAITALSAEVVQLRGAVANSASAARAMSPNGNVQQQRSQVAAGPPQPMGIEQEILMLCRNRQYLVALTKAVEHHQPALTFFACKNVDCAALFGQGEVGQSHYQPLLLCIMQQLSVVLVNANDPADIRLVLAWLQEVAVTMDPSDATIEPHVVKIVMDLLANLKAKMETCDPAFKRPLQTIMRVSRGLL